jgi:ribonuclease P protein component
MNGLAVARIALIVSKRNASRAVDRARVRRLIRERFRREQQRWCGVDCVIRLSNAFSPELPYADELIKLLQRAP